MTGDNKNLLIAILASAIILFGWHYIYEKPKLEEVEKSQSAHKNGRQPVTPSIGVPTGLPAVTHLPTRNEVLQDDRRIEIQTPKLRGSIRLKGGRIDDLILTKYHQTVSPESPDIKLLSPSGAKNAYYADFGWVSSDQKTELPTADTVWSTNQSVLTPNSPITLKWTNSQGMTFERTFAIDAQYLFTITQSVKNAGSSSVTLYPYSLISRSGEPETSGYAVLHEGALGYLNDKLKEYDYKDLREDKVISSSTTGGWLGITDKYWLTALIPNQNTQVKTNFRAVPDDGVERYQVDFLGTGASLAPGQSTTVSSYLFAGAKVVDLLDDYETTLGIKHFDLAVDFGWIYFLTKPLFYFMTFIHQWVPNYGIVIIILTIFLKLLFFPLSNKSYRSMARMKELQPRMKAMQERYKDDKMRLNQEMMALYKKEKVNPMAGCLPQIVQIPFFFALYKVFFVSIELRHAPFFGWIHDLSAQDPTSVFNLFGLIPWIPPSFLDIGALPIIMGLTMLLQQKLNPPPADPMQAKMFMFLPIVFTYMFAQFPAGLVLYWTCNNALSIAQQWAIMRMAEKAKK